MKKNNRQEQSLSNLLRGNTGLLVLSILKDGPTHGYAIAFEIENRSGDLLKFKHATLYPLLHELQRDGLITSEWVVLENERPRRVYAITEKGLKELKARAETFRQFSMAIFRVIGDNVHERSS